ncbi:MAG: hypothetical protein WCF85_12405 [Rhodospirillaceae bacterium]
MPLIALVLVFCFGVALLLRGFLMMEPRMLAVTLRRAGIAAGLLVALFLVLSGRAGLLVALAVMAGPMLWRARKRLCGSASGRTSRVETRLLRMILYHDTGILAGEIIGGGFAGRPLDSLSFDETMELMAECRRLDPQSITVLETWLDRTRGPQWRERQGAGARTETAPETGSGALSRAEALEILGLSPGATPEAIKEAHRHLMAGVHPDRGGSTWLAAKLNQARDALLHS